jgi:hypothetical protein
MTRSQDSHKDGKGKGSSVAYKALAATIPLVAAMVPIIGAFEHWFGGGPPAPPASAVSEYATVCNLSNALQRKQETQLAQFRAAFERARGPTGARDAMLLLTKQDIAVTSELENHIQALTPPQGQAGVQRQLERDWSANLTALGKYRERLGAGVASTAQLVQIAASLPRSSIEARTDDARGYLLRLGAPACTLDPEREQPIADWSASLRSELTTNSTGIKPVGPAVEVPAAPSPRTAPDTGPTPALTVPNQAVLPEPEAEEEKPE